MIFSRRLFTFVFAVVALSTNSAFAKDANISTINQARKLYALNKLDEAIQIYNQIPKTSEFWVEATEEKAWAYVRKNDFGQALAELKSILNPVFLPFVGPEAIMLAAFIDLKTCNYKGVFEKIALYKQQMIPRVEALEAIVNQPNSEVVNKWVTKMKQGEVKANDLGQDITKLPRFFYRDTLALKNTSRAKSLAKKDLEDISKNLKKMKIIEVEVVQRSYAFDNSLTKDKLKFSKIDRNNQMTFPYDKDSKEVWLDEIGSYQVKTQTCATSGVKK